MSQFTYHWHTDCEVPVVCQLDHQRFCKGSSEYYGGPPIEPDEPESMTLGAVLVNGVDIYYLLDEKQTARVEELALQAYHDQKEPS